MKYRYIDNIVGIEEMDTNLVEEKLSEFEKEYDLKVPEQYRKFMIEYNGGDTNNLYFGENSDEAEILLRNFLSFSIRERVIRGKHYSEFEYWNLHKKDEQEVDFETILPYKKVIVIADDIGDNSILISCEEEDYGQIYFQDHEHRDYFQITKVADSFNDFISGLKHDTMLPGCLWRERMLKKVKTSEELAELLEEFREIDEERNRPIYRELRVDVYDK